MTRPALVLGIAQALCNYERAVDAITGLIEKTKTRAELSDAQRVSRIVALTVALQLVEEERNKHVDYLRDSLPA